MVYFLLHRISQPIARHRGAVVWFFVINAVIGVVGIRFFEGFSWLDSLYWWVTIATTVGYGDLSPSTVGGKIFYMVEVFFAIATMASLIAIAGVAVSAVISKRTRGDGEYHGSDHIILVGWTEVTKLLLGKLSDKGEIIVVSPLHWEELDDPMLRDRKVDYYIRGDSTKEETLQRAAACTQYATMRRMLKCSHSVSISGTASSSRYAVRILRSRVVPADRRTCSSGGRQHSAERLSRRRQLLLQIGKPHGKHVDSLIRQLSKEVRPVQASYGRSLLLGHLAASIPVDRRRQT